MKHSPIFRATLTVSISTLFLLCQSDGAPYTKTNAWNGASSPQDYKESQTGAPLHSERSVGGSSASADASTGSLHVAAQVAPSSAYAYALAESRNTFTITGGTGSGTATFTQYLTGTFTATPRFSTDARYSVNGYDEGYYSYYGFSGTMPPRTFTYAIPFTFGTPFDFASSLNVYLSQSQYDSGASGSANLTLQSGGYSVTGAANYAGTSSAGSTKGSTFATNAPFDGFTLANTVNRQSTASLLDGAASTARNVSITFLAPRGDIVAVSDIVDLKGTQTDMTVLQLGYDAAEAIAAFGSEAQLVLSWFDIATQTWKNAVEGNSGGTATAKMGAYNPLTDFILGTFGIDTDTNTAWAVVDHNSEFVVTQAVPEPGSVGLLVLGALGLIARRRELSNPAK